MAINENFNIGNYTPNALAGNTTTGATANTWTIADFQKLLSGNQADVLGGFGNNVLGGDVDQSGAGVNGVFGKDGWGGTAISAFNGLAQSYLGLKQLGLAKDSLNFQKDSYATNLGNQATTVNGNLEDVYKRQQDAQGNDYSGLAAFKKDRFVSGTMA